MAMKEQLAKEVEQKEVPYSSSPVKEEGLQA